MCVRVCEKMLQRKKDRKKDRQLKENKFKVVTEGDRDKRERGRKNKKKEKKGVISITGRNGCIDGCRRGLPCLSTCTH